MNDYNQGFQNPNPRRKTGGKTWLWVLLAVLVVLVFWGVSGYNGFVKKQEVAYTELSNVQTAFHAGNASARLGHANEHRPH